MDIEQKYGLLQQELTKLKRVVVAYSGGVDSTFLLKVAAETLGCDNAMACIATSASLAKSQYERALENAQMIGVKIMTVELDELDDISYSANNPDRCFHCKSHLYKKLQIIAAEKGIENIICGSNFDDMSDFRPGNKAAEIFSVSCPLAKAQMTKSDIRNKSRQLHLKTADMPASPCLASRITYGLEITAAKLKQVECAEDYLRELGFSEFRVRHHGIIARLELKIADIQKALTAPFRSQIAEKLKALGFKYVTVDLQGFRSGSLNEVLTEEQKQNIGDINY